jgi:S-DNA-T family DNA segregation ATPase FtsK/SpoIIIE
MHIILSTQHPLGQISSQIKANIALRICLRMQDAMQSIDVLGDAIATELPGTAAGYAYCRDANGLHVFRGLTVRQPERLILAMNTACRFLRHNRPQELFTPPLPHLLHADMLLDVDSSTTDGSTQAKVPTARIGLQDDGMRTRLCTLRFDGLNVAVIGPPGSGKSSLLAVIAAELRKQEGVDVTNIEDYDAIAGTIRAIPTHTNDAIASDGVPKPQSPTCLQRPDEVIIGEFHASTQHSTSRRRFTVILIDTASDVSHRFDHPLASAGVQRVLQSDDVSVVFTCESMSQLPRSESFPWRIVFPTGEHDRDVMSGIPRCLLSVMRKDEFGLPGRGFIMRNGNAVALQCVGFARPGERPSSAVALELE